MRAFEIALDELSPKATAHVLIAGMLPTLHEITLVMRQLISPQALLLCVEPMQSRVEHFAHTINQRGLTGKVITYQGSIDIVYGAIVQQESIDALIYVPHRNDDTTNVVHEINRIISNKGKVALIEHTPAHPLSRGFTQCDLSAQLVNNGFSVSKQISVDRTHSVTVLKRI